METFKSTVRLPRGGVVTPEDLEALGCEIVLEEPDHITAQMPDGWRVDRAASGLRGGRLVTVVIDTRQRVRIRAVENCDTAVVGGRRRVVRRRRGPGITIVPRR